MPTSEPLTIRDRILIPVAVLLAIILVSGVIYGAVLVTRPPVHAEEEVYFRDVCVMLDTSLSMDPGKRHAASPNFTQAKRLVARLVGSCGPGDWVSVYKIGTGFSEQTSTILNDGVLPISLAVRRAVARHRDDNQLAALLRKSQESIETRGWLAQIEAVPQELPNGTSDYLSAFDYAAKRWRTQSDRNKRHLEIVVFGDLEQLPMAASGKPPAPDSADVQAFAGVHVSLSYPYRAGDGVKHMSVSTIDSYWREYFTQRGAYDTDVTIAPFGNGVTIPAPLSYE